MRKKSTLFLVLFIFLFLAAGCQQEQDEATPVAENPPAAAAVENDSSPSSPAEPTPLPSDEPEPADQPPAEPTSTTEAEPAAAELPAPEFAEGICPFAVPSGAEVTCGTVTVPENRNEPENGRTVDLPVAIFESTAASPAEDPVIYLTGGPGGHALELIQFIFEDDIQPFLSERDYIIFDQRGTGFAEPSLACPELTEMELDLLDDDLPVDEELDIYLEVLGECRQRLVDEGIDLSAYNSAENAADVEALRLALGYDSWNLLGVSYGTRLAQTVMRDFPAGLRSVVLDSPYPLEVDLQEALPGNMTRAFRVFFDGCAADVACSAAYPDLEEVFYNLVSELNETPISFEIVYFLTGQRYDVLFSGDDLIDILFQGLYSNQIFPLLPRMIYEVDGGETDTLGLLFTTFLINGEFISTGMYRSVQCHEELAFSDLERVAAASAADPLLVDYFEEWAFAYDVCTLWDSGTADPIENQPVVSDIPTLVLTGEFDPITPPAWGELLANNLEEEFLVEFTGIAHGASSSGDCPRAVTQAFLREPTRAPNLDCLAEMGPPEFDVPGEQVVEELELVPFESDFFGTILQGIVPDGWEEALEGTFSRGEGALDQTTLIYQAVPLGVVSPDEFLDLFFEQLGAEETGEPQTYVDQRERTWAITVAEVQNLPLRVATTEADGSFYAVILITNNGEMALLEPALFLPALEAVEVVD